MEFVGLIGIILALVLFLVLTYKGHSVFWTSVICSAVVIVFHFASLKIDDAITAYFSNISMMITQIGAIILGGVMLGKVFTDSGAAESIANALIKKFVIGRTNKKTQVRLAILALLILAGACTMGGIDGFVLTFSLFPICVVVAKMVDIPRRFIPAMLCVNAAFMAAPGAPQINNIMAIAGMHTAGFEVTVTSAWIPGLVSTIIILLGGYFTLTYMIIKAMNNGETFDFGAMRPFEHDDTKKLPNPFVAIIPLVVVFFLYTVLPLIVKTVHVNIFIALAAGIVVNIILMGGYLPRKNEKGESISFFGAIGKSLDGGAHQYPNAIMTIVTPAGFAGVIMASSTFAWIIGNLAGVQLNFMLLTFVSVAVIVGITSSPPVALMVAIPLVMGILGHSLSASELADSAPGIMRVAAITATTFETLPFNGLIMVTIGLAASTHKKSYRPQMYMTVVWTLVGALVAAGLIVLFPSLGAM